MAHRTILLKGDFTLGRNEFTINGSDIYPGMCCYLDSNGHATSIAAAGIAKHGLIIALEDDLKGAEASTIYTDDTQGQFYFARPGDIMALRVATGENIAIGDNISVDVNGDFCEATTGDNIYAIALEAPGALTADTLVKCIIVDAHITGP